MLFASPVAAQSTGCTTPARLILTSRRNAVRLEKLLRTNGKLKAAQRLRKTQDVSGDILTTLSGIKDVKACQEAFA